MMQEGSLTFRIGRTAAAAGVAMLRAAVWLVIVLVVALPLIRVAADWYVAGRIDLTPAAALPQDPESRSLPVKNATPAEAQAIRTAVGGLRYRVDPRTLSFVVVDDNPYAVGYVAEYMPYLDIIRIERSVVDGDGAVLRWTVAHEIGHYVDQRYLTPAARTRFEQLRHIPSGLSWESPTLPWARRPVEDFGEVFATISQTAVLIGPGTVYGPVRDPGAYERLLASVGVSLGREPPPRTWYEVLARELALIVDTVKEPALRGPLAIMFGIYMVLVAVRPAYAAWRRSGDAEGVPLDRDRRRVLNTFRRTTHRTGRAYVTYQDRHHGSRG